MGLVLQGGGLGMVEVLTLCLGLADQRAAPRGQLPQGFLPPALTQAGGPGGEMAGPGLEEQWCFILQIINYDSNPLSLLPFTPSPVGGGSRGHSPPPCQLSSAVLLVDRSTVGKVGQRGR